MSEQVAEIPVEEPAEEPGPEQEPVEPTPEEEEEEEATETDPEPVEEPSESEEPEQVAEGRCEAETTVGGTQYRCSLDATHDGEHQFQPLDASDTGEEEQASLEAFQKSQKRVSGYVERYQRVLREELGEEFDALSECPLCPEWTPGFFFPGQVLGMSDEQRVAVRLAIGDAELPSYQQDAHRHVCETCGGWGRVLTGSKRAQQDVLDCLDCAGKGFRKDAAAKAADTTAPEGAIVTGPWPMGEQVEPEPELETDPWGTPPGAPYYGVMLNFRPEGWEEEVAQWRAANGVS